MLACRVCLANKNVKLYDVSIMYNLKTAYETITGSQISIEDGLPQNICNYCSVMLSKCMAFRDRCCYTRDVMKYLVQNQKEITKHDIVSLQKQCVNLSQTEVLPVIDIQYKEPVIKQEFDVDVDSIVKVENELVEKPHQKCTLAVAKKRKKKTVKKKKVKVEDCGMELELTGIEIKGDQNLGCRVDNFDFPDMDMESDGDNDNQNEMDERVDNLKEAKLVILSREEQLAEMRARQASANYTQSKYQCHRCYRGFITEATYENHLVKHDPKSGDFECEVCGVRLAEARLLRAHAAASHERKFYCTLCDYVTRSSYRAKEHYKWHNGYKFNCKICGAEYTKSTSALTHMRLAHPSRHSCEVCGESFIGELGLKMHKRRAHRFLTDSTLQCVHCHVRFHNEDALSKHLETGDDGLCDPNLVPCHQCGQGYASDELLKTHLKEHQTFTCDECSCTFNSASSYGVHVERVHLKVRARPRGVTRRAPDTAVCEVCGKKCITRATLRFHMRTHTGEKPFQCADCPKRFSVFQRLQIHKRTHTGECPYKCLLCPKAFKHKAALNRHTRVHTGAKPYSCAHCGKCFSQSNSRKLHVNTVHLKLPAPYRNRKTT